MNVYLDFAATTPPSQAVLDAMLNAGREFYANPSSPHKFGRKVRFKVEQIRDQLSDLLNCKPVELIFTSGGTESNNMALLGTLMPLEDGARHIIISSVEHASIKQTCSYLETIGFQTTRISSTSSTVMNIKDVENALRPDTGLISIMDTNNETGLRYPVHEIAKLCKSKNILFHCDAVQSFGKFPLDLQKFEADLVSFSGHKVFGPKGTGLLYIREGTPYKSINFGGSQESNRRAGTENVNGIVGLQGAIRQLNLDENLNKVIQLQSYFEKQLKESIPFVKIIGEKLPRSPYISAVSFPGYDSSSLLMNLDLAGIAASTGSACSSGSIEPSQVLLAMKVPEDIRKGTLRFSFAPFTTINELDYVLKHLLYIIERIPNKATYA